MNEKSKVYLDYAASTPIDKRVLEAMLPYLENIHGNPASIHTYGQQVGGAIEKARIEMAEMLNCSPTEIIFTSGGTESDNLAIRGAAFGAREARDANHLLITPVEHHAVSHTVEQLIEFHDFEVEYLPVDEYGVVRPADVKERLRPDTAIVSVIYANNEFGSINPMHEIGEICREKGVPFHTDALQAAAYFSLDVEELTVDLMSLGAHKFYGPLGVGILYVKKETLLSPIQTGGTQERNMRAGTLNTPYIIGMSKALGLARKDLENNNKKLTAMRDQMIGRILEEIPHSKLTGHPTKRTPHIASFVFDGVDGNQLLMLLDVAGYACSSGSACMTGDPEPSDVILALGYPKNWAFGSLRVSIGRGTTPVEIQGFLEILPEKIEQSRNGSSTG